MPGRIGSFGFGGPLLDGTGSPCTFIPGRAQLVMSQCIFGTCLLLNDTKISCIEPSSGWPTNTSGEYTVAAWLSPYVALQITGIMVLFSVVDAHNNSIEFGINSFGVMFPQSNYNTPQLVSNSFSLFPTNGTVHAFPFVQAVGVWTHVAFVSVGGFVRIYINATLQSVFIAGAIQPIRQLPLTFNIGSKLDSDMESTKPFQGIVDELGVFNIALSQSQIADLYNVVNPTLAPPTAAPTLPTTAVPTTSTPSTVPTITAAPTTTTTPSSIDPTSVPTTINPTQPPTNTPSSSSSSTLDKMSDFFTDTTVVMIVWSILAFVALALLFRCLCVACNCCVHRSEIANYHSLPKINSNEIN